MRISIEQKSTSHSRALYGGYYYRDHDYLRLLFARVGEAALSGS